MIKASLSDAEIQRAMKDIRRYSKNVQNRVKRVIHLTAYDVDWDAKENAFSSLATGHLRGKIHILSKDLNNFTASVGVIGDNNENGAKYAPYVEFGTGSMVDVPQGLEDYAMQFKGKGIRQVNLPARPFLFPAAEKNRKKFIDNIKKEMINGTR